ncbi:MAG: hypothetical protein Q8P18_06605 [Pseudomonadota bacterium]|nr:hypothetical protein [Pseudomonadota bacterium]
MWLQLSVAHAQEAAARVDTYADGWIVVVSPAANVSVPLTKTWRVGGAWTADIVSGATPLLRADVVSSATHFEDTRHGVDLSATAAPTGGWKLTGALSASVEPDHTAGTAGVLVDTEAFGRMVTLSAGWHSTASRAGRADDAAYASHASDHALDLRWTQILDRATVATARLSAEASVCGTDLGCQANPYRLVAVDDLVLSERHPDRRGRLAGSLRVSRACGPSTALHGGIRAYTDTWRVTGGGADLSAARSFLGERVVVGATGRLGLQGAASFWRGSYGGTPAWRTADPELAGFTLAAAGGRAEWAAFGVGPSSRLALSVRVERQWYRYPDDIAVPRRAAWVIGGGLDVDY